MPSGGLCLLKNGDRVCLPWILNQFLQALAQSAVTTLVEEARSWASQPRVIFDSDDVTVC